MALHDDELRVLKDSEFLLLKHQVSEKVICYLADIERALREEIKSGNFPFPEGAFLKAGKISKGDNYRLLPYFILDYPRLFSRKEVFSYRTMLWWGNHFSCTLHVSGSGLNTFRNALAENIPGNESLWFCVNEHPWDYHFDPANYLPATRLTSDDINRHIDRTGFMKISDYLPLTRWQEFKSFTLTSFARFLRCLK